MKTRDIVYMLSMVIFVSLSYLLIDRGINAKTKLYVSYDDSYSVVHKVYLNDGSCINMGDRYPGDVVSNISFDLGFKSVFSKRVNGYYKYNVEGIIFVYTDDINDSLFQKKYILLNDTVDTLNSNGNVLNIDTNIDIDYEKYRSELIKIGNDYNKKVNGYMEIRFNVFESLDFVGMDNIQDDNKQMKIIIPLSYNNFRINVIKNETVSDSYYDFSRKQPVNYVLMVLGAFSLALGMSFLSLVIRNIYNIYKYENKYDRRIKKIFNDYGDIIIRVKKFYNKKKYNLIYVESFEELVEVYNEVRNPISFREMRKKREAIFLLLDDDNAWIYRMSNKNIK